MRVAVAVVEAADALADFGRDGYKVRDPLGGGVVPAPQDGEQGLHGKGPGRAHALPIQIGVRRPHIPRGGQAVADVGDAGRRLDPVAEARLVAEHQVIAAQIGAGEPDRVERQVGLVVLMDAGQPIQPVGADVPPSHDVRHLVRRVDRGVDRRLGKEALELDEHIFGASYLVEPVVDEGEGHGEGENRETGRPGNREIGRLGDRETGQESGG